MGGKKYKVHTIWRQGEGRKVLFIIIFFLNAHNCKKLTLIEDQQKTKTKKKQKTNPTNLVMQQNRQISRT